MGIKPDEVVALIIGVVLLAMLMVVKIHIA